jgi:hypothetical protein
MSSDVDNRINNGAILNFSQLIKVIMSSTAEAKLEALYINARVAVSQQQTLEEMDNKQPPTLMQTDNTTALGIVNNNIQSRHTKEWTCNSIGSDAAKCKINSNFYVPWTNQ